MSPVASITSNAPAWVMIPTQVAESKRTEGFPALWSMRKLPLAKVAPSMARPGFSVPPALTTPMTMMVPGPDGLVDTTWKYSVWAAGLPGAHADGSALPGPHVDGLALPGAHVAGPAPGPQPPAAGPGHPACEDQAGIRDALVVLTGEAAATATKVVLTAAAVAAAAAMAARRLGRMMDMNPPAIRWDIDWSQHPPREPRRASSRWRLSGCAAGG